MRVEAPIEMILDRRRSTSVCDDSRREPRVSSKNPLIALRKQDLRRRGPWLAGHLLYVRRDDYAGAGHVHRPHDAEHVRAIIR